MKQLRQDQSEGIDKLAMKARTKKRLIFQLATGGGKTVLFAGLSHRFMTKRNTRILILVHREELLKQARKTLFEWHEIVAVPITSDKTYFPNAQVYVAMVETAHNRLKKNKNYFGDVGLVIVDECHIGNFKKLYSYFPDSHIIGFTATPLASSAKDPLKNHFEDIVCGIDIPHLIELWRQDHRYGLVPNKTINVTTVKRSELTIRNGEFAEGDMAKVYSNTKHVQNCVFAYQQHCKGTKTLVFNCNIEHSVKVAEAFRAFGYNVRHLDGMASDTERQSTLRWFANTPDAVLCNVGVLTTGFDEPSIQSIIVNKSTMSLPLWLQMTGRGSRPFPGKEVFTIVDMGGNALTHGDWSDPRDWSDIFHNPPEPKAEGEAPVKECVHCHGIIHLSRIVCNFCGGENKPKVRYDMNRIASQAFAGRRGPDIYVADLVKVNSKKMQKSDPTKPLNPYYTLHEIRRKIVYHVKYNWRLRKLDQNGADQLLAMYQQYCEEWCAIMEKRWDSWHHSQTRKWMLDDLKKEFGWEPKAGVTPAERPVVPIQKIANQVFQDLNPFE